MKRIVLPVVAVALVGGLLAACSQKHPTEGKAPAPAATETPSAPAPSASGSDMSGMAMSSDTKTAKGAGTVTAVDAKAGAITIDHGPIPEVNWPAMKMSFKAAPELAKQVKPGDKVAFDLKLVDGGGEVTAIRKQ